MVSSLFDSLHSGKKRFLLRFVAFMKGSTAGNPRSEEKIFGYIHGLPNPLPVIKSRMSDADLLGLIRTDNPKGLSFLYETHRSEFIHWIMKFSHCDRDDAQEFYQASILIVYDNIRQGKLETLNSSLKTYLFGIGKNLAWNRYRQEVRKQKAGAEFYLQLHIQDESQEDALSTEMDIEMVRKCFQQLGDPCHTLLDLHYYHRRSMDEIALQLNYKNTDSAKNQKYKCMERLRKMVQDEKVKYSTE